MTRAQLNLTPEWPRAGRRLVPIAHPLRALIVALIAAGALPVAAAAQDAHYWTIQYGNRARLLGGSVVGSVLDLSAVYYNPGALSLIDTPELLLTGNVYQYSSVTWENALGEGRNLSTSRLKAVPSLFAGELTFGFLGGHRVAYSFLSRNSFKVNLKAKGVVTGETLPEDLALGTLSADLRLDQDVSENWGGLTWSHTLGSRMGIGISTFVAVRSQRSRYQTLAQVLGTAGGAGISIAAREFDYQTWRLLWKIGLSVDLSPWQLGLTVTTPSVQLFGSGTVGFDQSAVVQDVDPESLDLPRIVTDFQDGVPADYRSPASLAVGAAFTAGATRAHASAEYFDDVAENIVLDADPFVGQTTGDTVGFDVIQELDDVLNVAVGLEHQFSPKLGGYASFRTDFSAALPDSRANVAVALWDLYHIATGASFSVGRSEFTLGGVFAFGRKTVASGIDLLPDEDLDDKIGLPDQTDVSYFRLTLILGFQISL